jgi:hypothetical protein
MSDHMTLELHPDDNFIFALDVSGSMQSQDCPGGLSRFQYSIEKTKQFCHEAAQFASEGICLFRFGLNVTKFDHINEDKIDSIIASSEPNEMATMTNKVIDAAYEEHEEDKHDDSRLFIVTDGEPTNPSAVIDSIEAINKKVTSNNKFRIVFLTVGKVSDELQRFLDKLDAYKIVDVYELEKITFMASVQATLS